MSDTDTAGDIAKVEAAAAADPSVAASVALAGGAAVVAAAMTDGAASASGPADTGDADTDKSSADVDPRDRVAGRDITFDVRGFAWPMEHQARRTKCLELAISSLPSGGYYEPAHIVARATEFDAYITGAAAD